jgi:hypothetical protein
MNLINLTAVLDRMEEQQMIRTQPIVSFVVERLADYEEIFRRPAAEEVRPICNIICYLGRTR